MEAKIATEYLSGPVHAKSIRKTLLTSKIKAVIGRILKPDTGSVSIINFSLSQITH